MRRFETYINGDTMTLGHYMIIDGAFVMVWVLESIHIEYLVMMPSSLGDVVLCDGIEFHGKYLV